MTVRSGSKGSALLAEALDAKVRPVLQALQGSAVEEIQLEQGGVRLSLRRALQRDSAGQSTAAEILASAQSAEGEATPSEVRAHVVGVFHRAREPDDPSLAQEGEHLEAGQPLGVIETLGMASDVEAPIPGRLDRFAVEDGSPVGYGQLLATIATE